MSDELHIRLRHTQGDIGPIEVPGIHASNYEASLVSASAALVSELAEKLLHCISSLYFVTFPFHVARQSHCAAIQRTSSLRLAKRYCTLLAVNNALCISGKRSDANL